MCAPCKTKEPRRYTQTLYPKTDENVLLDYLIEQTASGTCDPKSLKLNALLIREYGERAKVIILRKRAEYRQWTINTQTKWRTSVSRRPQRGSHYDSWEIRERYCREGNGAPVSYRED
jgi:hypothetical protein